MRIYQQQRGELHGNVHSYLIGIAKLLLLEQLFDRLHAFPECIAQVGASHAHAPFRMEDEHAPAIGGRVLAIGVQADHDEVAAWTSDDEDKQETLNKIYHWFQAEKVPSSLAKMNVAGLPLWSWNEPLSLCTVPSGSPGTMTSRGILAPVPS